jgi:hypothetical protein
VLVPARYVLAISASAASVRRHPILGEPSAAIEPRNGALDDPAFGQDHKSVDLTISMSRCGSMFTSAFKNLGSCREQRLQKVKHTEQCRHDENASIAILNVGRMNDSVKQEA